MIHVRVDDEPLNSAARFACGIGWPMPPGDVYFEAAEGRKAGFYDDDVCPGCYPAGKPQIGTPIDQLSGRPGHAGFGEFRGIAASWGYD